MTTTLDNIKHHAAHFVAPKPAQVADYHRERRAAATAKALFIEMETWPLSCSNFECLLAATSWKELVDAIHALKERTRYKRTKAQKASGVSAVKEVKVVGLPPKKKATLELMVAEAAEAYADKAMGKVAALVRKAVDLGLANEFKADLTARLAAL